MIIEIIKSVDAFIIFGYGIVKIVKYVNKCSVGLCIDRVELSEEQLEGTTL